MQILSASVRTCPFASSQKLGKSVVRIHEVGVAGIVRIGLRVIRRRKIPIEMLLRALRTGRVDFTIVEAFALLGIAQ